MVHKLFTAFSTIRSNILSCTRFTSNVRCFQTIKFPLHNLRNNNNNITSQLKLRYTRIVIPVRHVNSGSYQEVDTNVANNVILWKFEKNFLKLKIFIVVQAILLLGVSYSMFLYLPNLNKYATYKEFVTDNNIILVAVVMPLISAVFAAILVWFFMTRSLKYIVLNKGGKMATLVSYHPLKETHQMTVPVNDVIVSKGRQDSGQYISVKVKNTRFFFLIDKAGIYVNPRLFDITIGASRL